MTGPIYLDNAATTPLAEEVREAMEPWLSEQWGNPSSPHRLGVRAREAIDRARAQVARVVGAPPEGVIFTSGGSEANNLALFGLLPARREGASIVVGPTEHASVREAARALAEGGVALSTARLDERGALDLEEYGRRLEEGPTLVAQMLVSNEFGSVYPLAELSRAIRTRTPGTLLHVDAIQALGKLELSIASIGADSISLCAHKIHGPKGVGALLLARPLPLRPLIHGGGQEEGRRSGTENVAGIVGFGRAAELAERELADTAAHLAELRARLIAGIETIEGLSLLVPGGEGAPLQPGIVSLTVPGAAAEVWLHHLDARGLVVGTGSACQARKKEVSPVLLAAGLSPDQARGVLRLSFSRENTLDEVDRAVILLREVRDQLAELRR